MWVKCQPTNKKIRLIKWHKRLILSTSIIIYDRYFTMVQVETIFVHEHHRQNDRSTLTDNKDVKFFLWVACTLHIESLTMDYLLLFVLLLLLLGTYGIYWIAIFVTEWILRDQIQIHIWIKYIFIGQFFKYVYVYTLYVRILLFAIFFHTIANVHCAVCTVPIVFFFMETEYGKTTICLFVWTILLNDA